MDAPTSVLTVVVMGVSGSGKTTVATGVADELGWPFAEGDEMHPPSNVEKMSSGRPLSDEDRWPWLDVVASWIGAREAEQVSAVVTCSALRRVYRDRLRSGHPSVWFAHVTADAEVLRERLRQREGHFMPASLLDSQLATVEDLQPDEAGVTVTGQGSPDEVTREVVGRVLRGVRSAQTSRREPGATTRSQR